ncbi:ArgE/DapE family deacylase [Minwuia thermotolerans]|uniref:Acetylornithine deacetylase n=1 Tax=Minwuia thermotolerans TaxID=2056226 RepID=A0A2M9G6I2_9PROT|nr:ArgE/DapE family deacylase [Minwuia thermotolerans]PJK31322.1 acetylornithine deacetylase [Minwuia thermotolerans]
MVEAALKERILAEVEQGFDAQVKFTQDLVRFPSQRGQEHTAQDFLYRAFAERDLAMDRWSIDVGEIEDHPGFSPVTVSYDNAVNVVGAWRPKSEKGRSLILNGHVDVVPVGPLDMWTTPPYEPRIEGDWLYGRGSGDMKAGIAANLFAFDALRRAGVEPASTVYMQSVTEEECTGNGALSCLVRGYHADAVLITEPTHDQLVRANVGVLWFQVEVRGRPAHVYESTVGSNAIIAAYKLIQALKELEAEMNAEKGDHPHFEDATHPITINIGKIAGGDWASSVPAWCRFDVRAGIYPGTSVEEAKRRLEGAIRGAALDDPFLSNHPPSLTYNGFAAEGYALPPGSDAEACLADAHRQVRAAELGDATMPAYLDARVAMLYDDTPALVYGPKSEHIHGFDERVSLKSTLDVTKTVALFVADWCGVEGTS